jgi:hypothetical protein
MKASSLVVASLLFLSSNANAEMTVESYSDAIENGQPEFQQSLSFYLTGVERGYNFTNGILKARGDAPFFCQPRTTGASTAQVEAILKAYIEQGQKSGTVKNEEFVELVLLRALMDAFPCEKR